MIFLVLIAAVVFGLVAKSQADKAATSQANQTPNVISQLFGKSKTDVFPDSQHVREQSQIIFGAPSVFNPASKSKGAPTGQTGLGSSTTSIASGGGGGAGGGGGYIGGASGARLKNVN